MLYETNDEGPSPTGDVKQVPMAILPTTAPGTPTKRYGTPYEGKPEIAMLFNLSRNCLDDDNYKASIIQRIRILFDSLFDPIDPPEKLVIVVTNRKRGGSVVGARIETEI